MADFLEYKLYCRLKLGTICWEHMTCFKEFPWLLKELLSIQYIDKSMAGFDFDSCIVFLWPTTVMLWNKVVNFETSSVIDLGSWWPLRIPESNLVSQCSYLKMTSCLSFTLWPLLKTLPWRAIGSRKVFWEGGGGGEKKNWKGIWQKHLRMIIDICIMIL